MSYDVRRLYRARSQGQHFIAPGMVLAWILLAWCPCALALNPALDVSQYAHTAWRIREGFSKGRISSIAQTSNGYLWLGTDLGLLRFDGVRPILWQPRTDQHLPSKTIFKLLAGRDGTLWIGTDKGLASWNGSSLTQYPELAGQFVFALLEDRDGAVWVGTSSRPAGKLCAIHNGSVQCYGEGGALGFGVFNLYEDKKGNLWVEAQSGLWRWKPGLPEFLPLPSESLTKENLAEEGDGTLLISTRDGIKRLVDGKLQAYTPQGSLPQFRASKILRDRDGSLWIGTLRGGLVHVHEGRVDVFSSSHGLSGDEVSALFEDREGNIWVVTSNGLDRFRELAIPTHSVNLGLSVLSYSVLAVKDGSVLVTTSNGVSRWKDGQFTTYIKSIAQANQSANIPYSLFQDARGRIWGVTNREFGYLESGRFISISGIPGGVARSIVENTEGDLWIANQNLGLFQLRGGKIVQQIPWDKLGHRDFAAALATDLLRGGLWLGFFYGGVTYFKDGQVRATYGPADGLGDGLVNDFRLDPDGTVWIATAGGLSRLKNNRIATLTNRNGLPCDEVQWLREDEDHFFWLYTACGLVRIAHTELDAWTAAVDQDKNTKLTIQATVFDISDGVRSQAYPIGLNPQVAKTADGKLWFPGWDGASVIDPRHLPFNYLPPPVHIEQITADRKTYDATYPANESVRLPSMIRDLQIDYTALSLVAPEKIRFRYKLEGWDRDWQDVGTRRQAFYTNLPPRNYRFRVMACNNNGVWNEAGTFLDFSIAPAFYQTTWFRVLCVAAFVALLAAAYQLRLRQMARYFNIRMEERVSERARIARDFHDTLLQSFQGVLLKFHALTYQLPERSETREKLESVIDQAQQAITEGRNAVQGLRSSTVVTNELARAISTLGEELVADQSGQNCPKFCVIVEGASRDFVPLVRDEVYRIASEALRNAFKHAQAVRIEVEILYAKRQFLLWIRDDGKGIDEQVFAEGGREGHYGLAGMHERAKLVRGKLAIRSRLGFGTEVKLTIPASVAYAKSPAARRSLFSRKGK